MFCSSIILFIQWVSILAILKLTVGPEPGLLEVMDMENRGIPIGRAAEVNLRNNHAQYIFTW